MATINGKLFRQTEEEKTASDVLRSLNSGWLKRKGQGQARAIAPSQQLAPVRVPTGTRQQQLKREEAPEGASENGTAAAVRTTAAPPASVRESTWSRTGSSPE